MTLKLKVLGGSKESPWYAEGLSFTCTTCGNCCTGGPGYVWLSKEEIVKMGEYLKMPPEEVVQRYCRKIGGQFSLRETRRGDLYDCVFLKEVPAEAGDGSKVVQSKRVCSVYAVRPLQCRTWPFWPENLSSPEGWQHAHRKCPGMGKGRSYTKEQIEAIRDAAEWPKDPPTSK